MLTIGVLGAGNTVKNHLRILQEIGSCKVAGYYDHSGSPVNDDRYPAAFSSAEELLEACDVIDIISPASFNIRIAEKALRNSKHVFIEQPFSNNVLQTNRLMQLARESGSKIQVGQNERFNAAFLASRTMIGEPLLIESKRHYTFNALPANVSLINDLLIHDIDIALSLIKANVRSVLASGVSVLNEAPDVINVRIEFDNGAVADLSISRIATCEKHWFSFYRQNACIEVDFRENTAQVIRKNDDQVSIHDNTVKSLNNISISKIEVALLDAVKLQLESFVNAVLNNTRPLVPIDDGYNDLAVANKIIDQLRLNTNFAASTIIA